VLVAGAQVRINSDVSGSVHAVGGTVEISGSVGRGVVAAAGRVIVGDSADIGGSVIAAASELVFRGRAAKDIRFYGDAFTLGGEVGRNTFVATGGKDRIVLEPTALLNGDFEYTAVSPAELKAGAVVKGNTVFQQLKMPGPAAKIGVFALGRLMSMFGLLVVGMVLVTIIPKAMENVSEWAAVWRGKSAGEGIIWLVLSPLVAIVLIFTVIGIPLALILLVLWAVVLYVSQVVVALTLGRVLLRQALSVEKSALFMPLVFGALVWTVITTIPLLGWVLALAGVILGMGSMIAFKRAELIRYR